MSCERHVPANDDAEQPRRVNQHFPIFQQAHPDRHKIPVMDPKNWTGH